MRILVSGLLQFDSGKTTFSLSLISTLKENGINFFPHKPIAAHNAWYSFSTLIRSEELGYLVGNDALKYFDEVPKSDVNEINPFAVLLAPPDFQKLNFDVRFYKELMSEGIPVLVRLHDCNRTVHFFLDGFEGIVTESLTEILHHLIKSLKAVKVSKERIKELIDSSPALTENCTQQVFQRYENVIVESYNDALSPNYSSLDVDLLFIITPGKALLIEDFKNVVKLFTYPPWLISASTFMKYVRVVRAWNIEVGKYKLNENLLDFILKLFEKNE